MTNKTQEVLKHLQKYKSITSYEAFLLYKQTRLSARIYDLRKKGYNIITKKEDNKDCNGTHARYILLKKSLTFKFF